VISSDIDTGEIIRDFGHAESFEFLNKFKKYMVLRMINLILLMMGLEGIRI
jgi:hypothetical protein